MKKIIGILLVLFVLFLVVVGAALFTLTRPGVQKKLVESQLPEGSSIRSVRVTTSSLELSELKLALPDGTEVRLAMFSTDFKPLEALFDRTVKVGALNIDGLVVEIPQSLIQSSTPSDPSVAPPSTAPGAKGSDLPVPTKAPKSEAAGSPMDALYAIGQLDWLFDIDSIQIDGELRDGSGSRYAMDLRSGAIRPGEESTIEASLKLSSSQALHAGLKEFDASARVFLKQNTEGGFEQVRVESQADAKDQSGNNLLSVSQKLDLSVQGFDERATLVLEFNADLPRPEVLLPELTGVGPLNIQGSLAADAEGEALTLSKTDWLLSVAGAELLSVKLNKQFTMGGKHDLSGNLMDVRLTNLQFAWLAPWLPQGLTLTGSPLSAQFNLTGLPGGDLQFSPIEPLRLGPLSLAQDGVPLLSEVSILAQPVIRLAADQSIGWDLGEFQVLDRYGEVLSGQSTGRFDASAPSGGLLPAGLQTQTKLNIGLQEITQQPALAGYTSIMSGRASLDLKMDASNPYPVQAQGRIEGISPRAYPGQRQDFQFALQLNEPESGLLTLGANFQSGSDARPTTKLEFTGQARPETAPLAFKADLSAQTISQRDIEFLAAAFQGQAGAADPSDGRAPPTPSTPGASSDRDATSPVAAEAPAGPPWAGYDGEVTISIAELVLLSGEVIQDLKANAVITEPLLSLRKLEGSLKGGKVFGNGEARYSKRQRMTYAIRSELSFEKLDPAVFSKKSSASFPVQGMFNGQAQFSGQGTTLEQALDDIEGELTVTGREGILSAFKLDNQSNIGLIGAGLLGQSLNRPGLTAMAKAVPYFENMPFSDFTLKLSRSSDKRIMIPELRFVGRNLLINGSGSIAATSLKNALSQPLDLTLEFGAKGALIEYLETLNLLGTNTSGDGFRRWDNTIQIKGTLSDPDTSVLQRILKEAASRALTRSSNKSEVPTEQNLNPSKEEKIIRDVETGLDLLNSVFGR